MKSEQPPWEKPQTPLKKILRATGLLIAQSIIAWLLFSGLAIVFFISAESWGNNESLLVIQEIARAIIYTMSVFLVVQVIDERTITSLGLHFDRRALIDLFAGILIMGFVLGISFLLFLGFGWIKVTGYVWQEQSFSSVVLYALGTFLLFAFVGWNEELLSRGFQLQTIKRGTNKFWGVLLSSLIFAYYHKNNPGITWIGLTFVFFAGILFAYVYLKTGQLWLSMGLHAGWDFFVVVVFYGIPIGNLRIFHLMNLEASSAMPFTIFHLAEFIELAVCFVLVRVYITARNKKLSAIQNDVNSSTV